jgi:hypothetical protein
MRLIAPERPPIDGSFPVTIGRLIALCRGFLMSDGKCPERSGQGDGMLEIRRKGLKMSQVDGQNMSS